jgi:hypothetical protein
VSPLQDSCCWLSGQHTEFFTTIPEVSARLWTLSWREKAAVGIGSRHAGDGATRSLQGQRNGFSSRAKSLRRLTVRKFDDDVAWLLVIRAPFETLDGVVLPCHNRSSIATPVRILASWVMPGRSPPQAACVHTEDGISPIASHILIARALDRKSPHVGTRKYVQAPDGRAFVATVAHAPLREWARAARDLRKAVKMTTYDSPVSIEGAVLGQPKDFHWITTRASETNDLAVITQVRVNRRCIQVLEEVLHITSHARSMHIFRTREAMLRAMQLGTPNDFHILHRKGEWSTREPRCCVGEDRILDMPSCGVGKVLGPLPIHTCITVHCLEADVRNVSCCILADEVIVPIEAILHFARWYDAVIPPIRGHFLPTLIHVDDVSILVSLPHVPRVLVVRVCSKVRAVVIHVSTKYTIWKMFGAHLAICCPLAKVVKVPRREKSMLVAYDVVANDIVGHADSINTDALASVGALVDAAWSLGTTTAKFIVPPLADDSIVADHVVHLVAIFDVDADTSVLPKHVGIGQTSVSSMDGDTRLERVYNSIALKQTLRALSDQVEVQTIATNIALLTTVLDASEANDTNTARSHHHCRKPLA